jgi:hypothetical protein
VAQIYGQTTIINNFDSNNHRRLQNNGISATVIGTARRHPVEAVPVSSLNHGRHHEWNGGNSHARIVGVVSTDNDATRNFAGAENHRNSQVQNIDVNNNHHPGASATAFRDTAPGHANPMASRPGQNQVAGAAPNAPTSTRRAQQNQNPSPVRDLILRGHPAQNPGTAINNYAAAQTPARSQARQPLTAGGVDYRQSRQPAWPFNGPPSVEHPQVAQPVRTAPVQIASAPVVSTERVQTTRGESRPNVSQNQSAPRNAASAAPAPARSQPQPSGNSGNNSGNFRGQGWVAQNH